MIEAMFEPADKFFLLDDEIDFVFWHFVTLYMYPKSLINTVSNYYYNTCIYMYIYTNEVYCRFQTLKFFGSFFI